MDDSSSGDDTFQGVKMEIRQRFQIDPLFCFALRALLSRFVCQLVQRLEKCQRRRTGGKRGFKSIESKHWSYFLSLCDKFTQSCCAK